MCYPLRGYSKKKVAFQFTQDVYSPLGLVGEEARIISKVQNLGDSFEGRIYFEGVGAGRWCYLKEKQFSSYHYSAEQKSSGIDIICSIPEEVQGANMIHTERICISEIFSTRTECSTINIPLGDSTLQKTPHIISETSGYISDNLGLFLTTVVLIMLIIIVFIRTN